MASTVMYNGQEYSTSSDVGKEALKWERPASYRAEQHPYPRMLYKASKGEDGVVRADAGQSLPRRFFANDQAYQAALDRDESFNNSCRMIVRSEREHNAAKDSGWRDSAEEAIAYCRHFETVILGTAAAEREYRDQKMSEAARAEAKAADARTPNILPEIPEAPLVKKPHHMSKEARAERANRASAA
jgi:hypothetical protein